jgi:malonyl-CoA O-methyltransferase
VRLVQDDVEAATWPEEAFDLVVSSAAVQWLAAPGPTTIALAGALAPGGAMVHATFGPGTFGELHSLFAEVERERGVEPRLHGLGLAPAGTWRERLEVAGLAQVQVTDAWEHVSYPGCLALLDSIRRTGASHVEPGVRRSPSVLRDVAYRYDAAHRVDGAGVLATYELLHLSGRRPERRVGTAA